MESVQRIILDTLLRQAHDKNPEAIKGVWMPRPKPTPDDLKKRKILAKEIKSFRKTYRMTQRALADLMREPGDDSAAGCRRTIQMLEKGLITPHRSTLTRFQIVKSKTIADNA